MIQRSLLGLFTISLLFLPFFAQAQDSEHPWAVGIHPGIYNYSAFNGGFFDGAQYGGGMKLNLFRRLSDGFDLGLESDFARIWHPLDPEATSFAQRDNFFSSQLTGRLRFDDGKVLKKDNILAPYLRLGIGVTSFGNFNRWGLLIPAGIGLAINIPKSPIAFHIQTMGSYDMLADRAMAQHSVGMTVHFGQAKQKRDRKNPLKDLEREEEEFRASLADIPDRDYDGVPDDVDECPDIFGSALTAGCPDSDKDGVRDSEDLCPDLKGFANLQGCLDSDYDGVIDPLDKCPDVYGTGPDGCPEIDPNDIDGDGVPNDEDECPEEPGSFLARGCPDADGDGIADKDDLCPNHYGLAEYEGCPIPKEDLDRLKKQHNEAIARRDALDPNSANYLGYDPTDPKDPRNPNNPNYQAGAIYYNPDDLNDPRNPKSKNYDPAVAGLLYNPNNLTDPRNPKSPLYDSDKANLPYNPNDLQDPRNPKNPNYDPSATTWVNRGGTGSGIPGTQPATHKPGAIFIGNPASDKFVSNVLKGFAPYQPVSPEDQEYCQRIDLTELKAAIYFDYNDTRVERNSAQSLDRVVDIMRRCAMLELQIAAHTDNHGSDAYNLTLSERRAKAVLEYISGKGIDNRRLKYNAYGKRYPTVPNSSKENRQVNRRAEVRVNKAY